MADSTTRFVKPAPDRKVRWPDGRLLDADGEAVPANDPFWLRRIADEDVELASPKSATKKEA